VREREQAEVNREAVSAAEGPSPELVLEDVRRALRSFEIRLDLRCDRWPLVLLGPSGAGKTQVLRMLCGLETPANGRIAFGNEVWFDSRSRTGPVPAHLRRIGYCIQEQYLFPHKSVLENVAYPLEQLRPRPPRSERRRRAWAELARLRIEALSEARPHRLSGGERGRAALARALVHRPRLLALDEPFAGLDPPTRDELLREVQALFREIRVPVVWVTHDRNEAMRLGGTVAVLLTGRVAQAGPAEEIFRRPVDPAVAEFVGIGTVLHGRVLGSEQGVMEVGVGEVRLYASGDLPAETPVLLFIRSEDVELLQTDETRPDAGSAAARPAGDRLTSARNSLRARVVSVRPMGLTCLIDLDIGMSLTASVTRRAAEELHLEPGRWVIARAKAVAVRVQPEDGWDSGPAG
jgi:molybdopterin-binding protein